MRRRKRRARKDAKRWVVKALIQKHGGLCVVCRVQVTFEHNAPNQATIDHIIPTRADLLSNMQLLCNSCNNKKGDTYEERN